MSTPDTRIYHVTHIDANGEPDKRTSRLVRAKSRAQARHYAARKTIAVDLASQEQCIALAMAGQQVEDASAIAAEPADD